MIKISAKALKEAYEYCLKYFERYFAKPRCYICGKPADYLCDWVLEYGLENPTCDRPICNEHRKIVCKGIDYCPEHAELA